MKITEIEVTPVTVPLEAPIRWSMGVEIGTTRTIIKVKMVLVVKIMQKI